VGQIGATCVALAVVAVVVIHAAIIRLALRMFEYAPPFNADDDRAHSDAEEFSVVTADGVTIIGSLHRRQVEAPKGVIIFSHEFGADRWSAYRYSEGLLNAGFYIVAFDFRCHGESSCVLGYEPIHWLTKGEIADLDAVLEFVKAREDLNALPIGLFGISRGACASLAVAANHPEVSCVCADSAFTTHSMTNLYAKRWLSLFVPGWAVARVPAWHINFTISVTRFLSQIGRQCRYVSLEQSLGKLHGRHVSLISGKRDTYVLPEIAKHLYDSIGGDEVTLWLVTDAKHNKARSVATLEYDARLVEFFEQMQLPNDEVFEEGESSEGSSVAKASRY
jgi:pimeloyl-ACP methyl ester carboxylesterase